MTLALAGSDVTLTGKADLVLFRCKFSVPSADNAVDIHFNDGSASANHGLARYHGSGLDNKECGVRLVDVKPELSGFVRSWVVSSSSYVWSNDFVELIVASECLSCPLIILNPFLIL